ncbi:hypothetical protein AB0K48_04950, partial [Nonomuraea sp. NPDC055795]
MPERARSLAEGYVYLDLAVPEGGETSEPEAGEDAWTLRLGTIEVEVPYEGERAARLHELRFGPGISRLIDAGQWVVVAGVYARRALAEDLEFAAARVVPGAGQGVAVRAERALVVGGRALLAA